MLVRNGLLASIFLVALVLIAPRAWAQSIILNDDQSRSVITGTIGNISYNTMELILPDETSVDIELDDLDLSGRQFDNYFSEGTRVQVVGHFDDDGSMRAKQVIKLTGEGNLYYQPNLY